MNSQDHEGSARRLDVAGDLSPIFVRELDLKETVNVLFTCTAFVSKIRRLYRQPGEVNQKRRKGRQRILSCKLVFVLFMFGFLNNILNNIC